jgi:two-component system chemotaxis response regulator CheY
MVKVVLGPEGHSVVSANDGAAGLAKAKAQRFDLILTDLNMPVMNGMEMIKAVRALPNYVGVPIVFLTTESDESMKSQAKAAGATGWLTKPFKPEQLHAVIAKLVRK